MLVKVGSADVTVAVKTPLWKVAATVTSLASVSNATPATAVEVSSLMM